MNNYNKRELLKALRTVLKKYKNNTHVTMKNNLLLI